MGRIIDYIESFFSKLEVYEDIRDKSNHYKQDIEEAVIKFISDCNIKTAFKVYEMFFEAYWIGIQDEKNPFIELIEKMKSFEENAGLLLRKQRDHYVHSVYVFILGLAIFNQNKNFQNAFNTRDLDKSVYKDSYDTNYEEFFYRWGIASLFHDIAYPLEITINQINIYVDFLSHHSDARPNNLRVKMSINKIADFNKLPQLLPLPEFSQEYNAKYPNCKELNLADSIDLLSHKLNICFGLDIDKLKKGLINFAIKMKNKHFIDHGYYSALIVLRWYYYLIQKAEWNPAYFYFPIVDAASAILLHNYYEHGLMKRPFKIGKFKPENHPIAYLLKLCDELQDWSRAGYGEIDRIKNSPTGFEISISDEELNLIYKMQEGDESDGFIAKKLNGILSIVEVQALFKDGIKLFIGKDEQYGKKESMR